MLRNTDKITNNTTYGGPTDVHPFNLNLNGAAPLREAGIYSLGLARLHPPYEMTRRGGSERPHTHFHFILEGAELLETFEGDYLVKAGSFVTIPQRLNRRFSIPGEDSYLFIYFSVGHNSADHALKFDKVEVSPCEGLAKLEGVYRMMADEAANPKGFGSEALLKAYAEAFRLLLYREVNRIRKPCKSQEADALLELWEEVERSLEEPWSFASLAEAMGVSKTQLHALCVRHYGTPPMERLTELRMEKARRLLLEGQESLDSVAAQVGYGSAFSFSKAFLKRTGLRPGAFRRGI